MELFGTIWSWPHRKSLLFSSTHPLLSLSCALYLIISHLPSYVSLTLIFIFAPFSSELKKQHVSYSHLIPLAVHLSPSHVSSSSSLFPFFFFITSWWYPLGPSLLATLLSPHFLLPCLSLSSSHLLSALWYRLSAILPFWSASYTLLLTPPLSPSTLLTAISSHPFFCFCSHFILVSLLNICLSHVFPPHISLPF